MDQENGAPDIIVNATEPDVPLARRFFTDGIIVTLATGLAYVAVFSYDVGYAKFFYVPTSLISISIPNLVSTALIFIFCAFSAPMVASLLPWFDRPTRFSLFLSVGIAAIATELLVVIEMVIQKPFFLLIFLIGIAFLWFFYFVMKRISRKRPGFGSPTRVVSQLFPSPMADVVLLAPMFAAAVAMASFASGQAIAMLNPLHLITVETKPKALLAIYGDVAVTADYDKTKQTVGPTLKFYKVDALPSMRETFTGKLTFNDSF